MAPGTERGWCAASYHGAPFIRDRTTSQRLSRSLVLGDLLLQLVRVGASGGYGDPRTGTFPGLFLFVVERDEAILEPLEFLQYRHEYLGSPSEEDDACLWSRRIRHVLRGKKYRACEK